MKSNFPVWNDLCEDGFPSARQVANCLGVTESTVSMYRSGKRGFTAWEKLLELDQPPKAREYAERMARGEPPVSAQKIKAPEVQPEGIATEALTRINSSEPASDPLDDAPNPNSERFKSPNAGRLRFALLAVPVPPVLLTSGRSPMLSSHLLHRWAGTTARTIVAHPAVTITAGPFPALWTLRIVPKVLAQKPCRAKP